MLSFLFSMRGRVNRAQYWLGSIGIYVGMWMALVAVVFITLGSAGLKPTNEAAAGALLTLLTLGLPVIGVAIWMQMALQIKRLHDRGRSWVWSMLPFAVSLPFYMSAFSAGFSGGAPAGVNPMDGVLALAVMAVSLWMFVDLGCLPGQEGPNKYGDPPGGGGGRAPVAPSPSAMQPHARPAAAAQMQMQSITGNGAAAMRGADAAMERAIAEQAMRRAQQPAPASTLAGAPRQASPGLFGRRVSR